MGNSKNTTIGKIGELALIRRICAKLPVPGNIPVGPGDDCAVVRLSKNDPCDWLLKSDPVIEGVHFAKRTPGAAVGHKALGRVLSDMAAMGAEPVWVLVDFVAPARMPVKRLEEILAGFSRLARKFKVSIIGGDVARGPVLELHVFGIGRVKKGQAVLRSGARVGDSIFVTGSLGGSLRGKHLNFKPRLGEGQWLGENKWAGAMIDISDGLATDLRHLAKSSRAGAELNLDAIPLSAAARQSRDKRSALTCALLDGEDYELLFTVRAAKREKFTKAWRNKFNLPCTCIGVMTRRMGVLECVDKQGKRKQLRESGYEHFR